MPKDAVWIEAIRMAESGWWHNPEDRDRVNAATNGCRVRKWVRKVERNVWSTSRTPADKPGSRKTGINIKDGGKTEGMEDEINRNRNRDDSETNVE